MRSRHPLLIALVVVSALTPAGLAQERDRTKIPDKYKWNLADIYPDVAAWNAARTKVEAEVPKLRSYQGKLATSPQVLGDALEHIYRVDKELQRLGVYASMLADQDTRESAPQGMVQQLQRLAAEFGATVSYLEPEILKWAAPPRRRRSPRSRG